MLIFRIETGHLSEDLGSKILNFQFSQSIFGVAGGIVAGLEVEVWEISVWIY